MVEEETVEALPRPQGSVAHRQPVQQPRPQRRRVLPVSEDRRQRHRRLKEPSLPRQGRVHRRVPPLLRSRVGRIVGEPECLFGLKQRRVHIKSAPLSWRRTWLRFWT